MNSHSLLLIGLLVVTVTVAGLSHQLTMRYIRPRDAFWRFLLYVGVNLLLVMVLVFLTSFVIFKYKEFFFKR